MVIITFIIPTLNPQLSTLKIRDDNDYYKEWERGGKEEETFVAYKKDEFSSHKHNHRLRLLWYSSKKQCILGSITS